MRVVVLGAGVIGAATAYVLAREGHEVTVVEREAEPASATSYANAGLVAPGHAFSWASPAAPGVLLRSLFKADQALRLKPSADPRLWLWLARFLRECTAAEVLGLDASGHRVTRVVTDRGYLAADAVVLCLGCDSALFGRRFGLSLPIYPVKGYSVTLPARQATRRRSARRA